MENGIRALWLGSNPHSNGDDFSRSVKDRAANIHDTINKIKGKIMATIEEIKIRFIN